MNAEMASRKADTTPYPYPHPSTHTHLWAEANPGGEGRGAAGQGLASLRLWSVPVFSFTWLLVLGRLALWPHCHSRQRGGS